MAFDAKILADSISPDGVRLTTFEVTFPRIVLAEFNTHRVFSRNSASSRAIPVEKMLKRVQEDPYIPTSWGKNQKGMQAEVELNEFERGNADLEWLLARDHAVSRAEALLKIGVHKQLTNRLLEPFLWHTVIVTATEWSNFFNLRNNPAAHPEIQIPAQMMQELYYRDDYEPQPLHHSQWHLPLCPELEETADQQPTKARDYKQWVRIGSARCARVSYLTHDGRRDVSADLELHDRLLGPGHMSPFEHVARPMTDDELNSYRAWDCLLEDGTRWRAPTSHYGEACPAGNEKGLRVVHATLGAFCGNFNGWVQYRKTIPHEENILEA